MLPAMMTLTELINALGGPSVVAKACGNVNPSAVTNWVRRGAIPAQRHIAVWQMAQDAGLAWAPPKAERLQLVERR